MIDPQVRPQIEAGQKLVPGEIKRMEATYHKDSGLDFLYIDAEELGNETRMINTGVLPVMSQVNVFHVPIPTPQGWRVFYYAGRDIKQGDELHVYYGQKHIDAYVRK